MTADAQDELLDVVDDSGRATGERRRRASCHRLGLPHRAVHVWVCSSDDRVLLQQRSRHKLAFPLRWDVSAAGHVPAGEAPATAAAREAAEELGIASQAAVEGPLYEFVHRFATNGGSFVEREHVAVFGVFADDPCALQASLDLQACEVEAVRWVDRRDYFERVERGDDPTLVNVGLDPAIVRDICARLGIFVASHNNKRM